MSSSCGSVCLLVLLGVVLASGSPLPETLNHNHDSITTLLRLAETDIGSHPLFSSVLKSINTSCQRKEDILLMNATLDVYTRIFSSILHNHHQHHGKTMTPSLLDQLSVSDRTQVKNNLKNLQDIMEKLKGHLGQLNHDKEDMMNELRKIKVDDPIDQRKALAEFKQVYQAAFVVSSTWSPIH